MIPNDQVIVIDTRTGATVTPGDTVIDFRGGTDTYRGVSRLPQPGKSGKVITDRGEYYEKVFSLEIHRDPETARVRSLECRASAADTGPQVTMRGDGSVSFREGDGPEVCVRMKDGQVEIQAVGQDRWLTVLGGDATDTVTVKPC